MSSSTLHKPGVIVLVLAALSVSVVHTQVSQRKRVCYFTNWSRYRKAEGKFKAADIPPFLCTHLIFAFGTFDDRGNFEVFDPPGDRDEYTAFAKLKEANPQLKTLLAVGGWNFGSSRFSSMANNPDTRRTFAISAVSFLRQYGFDGLDIDWEYPTLRDGQPQDKHNFAILCKELYASFSDESRRTGRERMLLTAAVSASVAKINDIYDIQALNRYMDFINVMTYDFHGDWENVTGQNSPLYASPLDKGQHTTLNTHASVMHWHKSGMSKDKIVVGMATYGRIFSLTASNRTLGSPATIGPAGEFTQMPGFLAYYEICKMIDDDNAYGNPRGKVSYDVIQQVPFYANANHWVGYDNIRSIRQKARYIMENGYGGFMVWSLDLDDFNRMCKYTTKRFPLISAAVEEFGVSVEPERRQTQFTTSLPSSQFRPTSGRVESIVTTRTDTATPARASTVMTIQTAPIPLRQEHVITCPPNVDTSIANPMDCARYVRCVNGMKYDLNCPPGLHWDDTSNTCNWPDKAGCVVV